MKFSKVFILPVMLALFAIPVVAHANAAGNATHCSLATLKGSFGLVEEGTIVVQSPPLLFVTSGIIFYDGHGKLSGSETTNLNGAPMPDTFTGTYTVNSDCTYSDSVVVSPSGALLNHQGTIIGDGLSRELHVIGTDLGVVSFATLKKTPPGGCSLETLKGKYVKFAHTTVVVAPPGFPPTPFPTVDLVIVTYDGAGNAAGTFTVNFDGFVFSGTGTSTYTMNRDCSYSEETTLADGSVHHATGTVTGEGTRQEVQFISPDNGQVSLGTMKKMVRRLTDED